MAENVDAVQPFKGKRLLGALCGMEITRNTTEFNKMVHICKTKGYQIFLQNGSGDLSPGDGCIILPGGRPCASSAASCSARSINAQSVRRQRQRLALTQHMPCRTCALAFRLPRKVPAPGLVPLAGHARIAFL